MKKRWMILIFIFICSSIFAGDIYLHLLTTGQPQSTYYLGDKMASLWYVNMEVGQTTWNASDIGIGQSDSGTGENWDSAIHYEDGFENNRKVRRNIEYFQFTATGNWYFYGRAKGDSGDDWHYANDGGWGNPTSLLATEYFSVNALNNPTFTSVTKSLTSSSTEIDLSISEDTESHNVLIVRRESSAVTWTPLQGTTYSIGEYLGTDHVIVNGSFDPSEHSNATTDDLLIPETAYYYKIFSENNNYYSSGVEASTSSATTDVLPQPSSVSSTMLSDSKINVEWTPNANYGNVMVIARKGSDLSADPTNGTEYNVSDAVGDGTVIYKDSGSSYTYSGLDANSTYYFRVYTVDYVSNYYSANTSINETTHDGTTYHLVELTGNENDFSSSENVSGDYYLTWDATYLYAAIFNGIDLLDIDYNNKFAIAIDKDPGTANGYAPPDWGGYNFAANNDGTHNLEYIFIMGRGFTSLYNSGDSFVNAANKSIYNPQIGTYA